jgi:outer membrane cobalamin receptor
VKKLLLTLLILLSFSLLKAEEDLIKVEAEEVVITAHRVPTQKSKTGAVVEIISGQEIKSTPARTVADLLAKNACFDLIKYPAGLAVINLRGFAPKPFATIKHYALLINGREAGTTNLDTLLLENVERIEILKGPASSLYGAQAMAGVVNIITKKSQGKIKTNYKLTADSFQGGKVAFSTGGTLTSLLNFDLHLTGVKKMSYSVPKFIQGNFEWPGGRWEKNESLSLQGDLRLGLTLNPQHQLDFSVSTFSGESEVAGDIFEKYPLGKNNRKRGSFELNYGGKTKSAAQNWQVKIFQAEEKKKSFKQSSVSQKWYPSFLKQIKYFGAQTQTIFKFGSLFKLTTGLDYNQDQTICEKYKEDGTRISPYYPNERKINYGFFSEGKLNLLGEKIILTTGGRYDAYVFKTLKTPHFTGDYQPGEEKLSSVNPRFAFSWQMIPLLRLHSTVGTAFVPPNAYQKAGYYTKRRRQKIITYQGNPALRPEKSLTGDLGIEVTSEFVHLDLTFFQTKVKDKIQKVKESSQKYTYQNLEEVEIAGVEKSLSFNLGKFLELNRSIEFYTNLTYLLKAENITTKERLFEVAKLKIRSGASYLDERVSVRLNSRLARDKIAPNYFEEIFPDEEKIEYDDLVVFDLSLGYQFTPKFRLNLQVENLFNRAYQEKIGYPGPGRCFYLGVEGEF